MDPCYVFFRILCCLTICCSASTTRIYMVFLLKTTFDNFIYWLHNKEFTYILRVIVSSSSQPVYVPLLGTVILPEQNTVKHFLTVNVL